MLDHIKPKTDNEYHLLKLAKMMLAKINQLQSGLFDLDVKTDRLISCRKTVPAKRVPIFIQSLTPCLFFKLFHAPAFVHVVSTCLLHLFFQDRQKWPLNDRFHGKPVVLIRMPFAEEIANGVNWQISFVLHTSKFAPPSDSRNPFKYLCFLIKLVNTINQHFLPFSSFHFFLDLSTRRAAHHHWLCQPALSGWNC